MKNQKKSLMPALQNRLVHGFEDDELEYYYQPIFDVKQECISRAELLLRIRNGTQGHFAAVKVVKASENLRCINILDKYAFRHACLMQKELRSHGILELNVNLSPITCYDRHFIPSLVNTLFETGATPKGICLEITESKCPADEQIFYAAIRTLYDLGFQIAIDDFGSGYSDFQRLLHIPLHIIKLDKSLVSELGKLPLAEPLIEGILHFAQKNRLAVVAEGVETLSQAQQLSALGCPFLQGYLLSKPVDKQHFFALLQDKKTLLEGLPTNQKNERKQRRDT